MYMYVYIYMHIYTHRQCISLGDRDAGCCALHPRPPEKDDAVRDSLEYKSRYIISLEFKS